MEIIKLQVLIATFGIAGLKRIAEGNHPRVAGVEYIVSCQLGDKPIPPATDIPEPLQRPDIKIHYTGGYGSPKNRNRLFSLASAPVVLISDDDIMYTADGLNAIIDCFDLHPEIDFASFKIDLHTPKYYPEREFSYTKIPRGFWISGIELALRRKAYTTIRFDERFGVNAMFPAGEEDIFLLNLIKAKLKGRFFPIEIGSHPTDSTCDKLATDANFLGAKGAVVSLYHPHTYRLRLWIQGLRYCKTHPELTPVKFYRLALAGVKRLRQSSDL